MNLLQKSDLPVNKLMGGMRTSLTKELTTLPKAAPTMIPTAMSSMFPRIANSLNSPRAPPPLPNSALGLPKCAIPSPSKIGSLLVAISFSSTLGHGAADHCRGGCHRSDFSFREASLLLGRHMPRRRRERRHQLQPQVAQRQPPHAALTQSGGQRCRQSQGKYLRNCVSPLRPPPRT